LAQYIPARPKTAAQPQVKPYISGKQRRGAGFPFARSARPGKSIQIPSAQGVPAKPATPPVPVTPAAQAAPSPAAATIPPRAEGRKTKETFEAQKDKRMSRTTFGALKMPREPKEAREPNLRVRTAAIIGLCLLLVGSGYAARLNRTTNKVNYPVNVFYTGDSGTQMTAAEEPAQPEPEASGTEDAAAQPAPSDTGKTPENTPDNLGAIGELGSDAILLEETASQASLSSFTAYKVEMDAARTQSIRMLDALIDDVNTDAATIEQARAEKLQLSKAITQEASLESLIAARGFGESYVTVSPNAVNVVVHDSSLTDAETAAILDMVATETGISGDRVKIIVSN